MDNLSRFKNKILGRKYELSFAYLSDSEIKKLNKTYRKKNEPTDILSFPLTKWSGEVVVSLQQVKKKARFFGKNPKDYLNYLLIHGLLHLQGRRHGKIMTTLEKKWVKFFKV